MVYENTNRAIFLSRPNRFIANIMINGREEVCHVKNTGRCRELLIPGADIVVSRSDSPGRKTSLDLIAVYKGKRLINIDSSAPNKVAFELVRSLFPDITYLRTEKTYGSSRFDLYFERPGEKAFAEVKGVTLERDGAVYFPDAPTERGLKHVNGLIDCVKNGFGAYLLFIIQMNGARFFSPNDETHAAFGDALRLAAQSGVGVIAYDCKVTESSIEANAPVPVAL